MPRDKFISDNLIDIRDRLRQNYESMNSPAPQPQPSSQQESDAIHLDLKNPVIQAAPVSTRSADREYNEFAGRLEHDLASVSAELTALEEQQKILDKFYSCLKDSAALLDQLPPKDSADFFRELDRLRISYFQASGSAAPFRKNNSSAVLAPIQEDKPPTSSKNIILSAAVLLGAIAVCLTLIILFA